MPRDNPVFLNPQRVWVSCHTSPVGAAVVKRLWRERCEIVLAGPSQLDMLRQSEVEAWFRQQKPDLVFLTDPPWTGPAEADAPVSVLQNQLMVNINVLAAARTGGATVVNLTACGMAARGAPGLAEAWTWRSAKALANLATIRLTQGYVREHGCRFIAVLSSCVYGPGSRAVRGTALLPELLARFADAARRGEREVDIGGDVIPYGVIHADDLADAAVFLARRYDGRDPVHCRLGVDSSLRETAERLADLAGYRGRIVLRTRLDDRCGRPIQSVGVGSLGWRPEVSFADRLREFHDAWREDLTAAG